MNDATSSSDPAQPADVVGEIPIESGLGRLLVATTVLGSSVAMLTATVVNVALPVVARDLEASSSAQQWIINAYLLTISALILIGGTLGDRFGRLRVYRIGLVWFAVASLACAVAPDVPTLIVARLFQGVGGALVTPGSLAIIEASLRPDDRGRGVGRWSGLIGLSGAVGPLLGGLLVDLTWRAVFLINLPITIAVLIMSVRLPESSDPAAREQPIDYVGAILTVLTLGGSSYALIEGPNNGFAGLPLVATVVAVASLVGLLAYEPRHPGAVVPIGLFANRVFATANLVTFLVYGAMGVVFFLIPLQLQVTVGYSPLQAGAVFLPVTLMMFVLSSHAGDYAQRNGPRVPLTVGPLLIAAGMLLYTRIGPGASYFTDVLPSVLVHGLGVSIAVAPVTSTALGSVPSERSGAASGVNNAISRTGQLLAIAAVPPLVGLTGPALGDAGLLDVGFDRAMVVSAVLVTAGAVTAAVLFGPPRASLLRRTRLHRACPVDGAYPHATPAPEAVAGS
ncbi:MAG: MFS transporter [Actinomycetota bacterium]